MKKEIKFTTLQYSIINGEGLEHHLYVWNKESNCLTHYINNEVVNVFNEKEARKILKQLIGKQPRKKQNIDKKQDVVSTKDFEEINNNQLKMF